MKPRSSDRSFGILFFIVFTIIALWPIMQSMPMRPWSLAIGLVFLIISLLKPVILRPLNNSWIKLGEVLGRIISPIIMMIIFFFLITPLSLLLRLFGKDILNIKFGNSNSYWIDRKKEISSMNKQF